jgi:enamine deaminase RidA (YjgF/YER057c/UK114 family)
MSEIIRHDVNEEWAHSGMVEAGGFIFISYCACDGTGSIESQINRVFDHLCLRLESIGLTLESVVKLDALFKNIWDIPVMETIIKERFNGKYPARKSIQTNFASEGLLFQLDAIAYRELCANSLNA